MDRRYRVRPGARIDGHLNGRLGDIYFYSRIQVDARGIIGVGHNLSIRGFRP